jgi:hypothetical protein
MCVHWGREISRTVTNLPAISRSTANASYQAKCVNPRTTEADYAF